MKKSIFEHRRRVKELIAEGDKLALARYLFEKIPVEDINIVIGNNINEHEGKMMAESMTLWNRAHTVLDQLD